MRWVGAVLVTTLVTTLGAGGCDEGTATRDVDRYVALGDSFTSGAGLPLTRRDALSCGRSSLSYPHLVAEAIGAELVDVSCGGATTENGTEPQSLGGESWPPQLTRSPRTPTWSPSASAATTSRGTSTLMFSCTSAAAADPTGNPCEEQGTSPESDLTALPPQIGARLEALLTEVHRRAPAARVLLVGYPQLVPARGTCPELPLATGDYPFVRAQWEAMDAAMREAAAAAGATYVAVLGPSEGHDICAGPDAWVNGFEARSGVAAAYHPLAGGQAAVAELVEEALRGDQCGCG